MHYELIIGVPTPCSDGLWSVELTQLTRLLQEEQYHQ